MRRGKKEKRRIVAFTMTLPFCVKGFTGKTSVLLLTPPSQKQLKIARLPLTDPLTLRESATGFKISA
jgi:hypothetical protein